MPAEAEEKIEEYMAELNEQVAETDEALMEKFSWKSRSPPKSS